MVNLILFVSLTLIVFFFSHYSVSEELRDPTKPLFFVAAEKKSRSFVLQAIYKRSAGNLAVINGETLRVGAGIDGARVVTIAAASVRIEENGKSTTLYLRPSIR